MLPRSIVVDRWLVMKARDRSEHGIGVGGMKLPLEGLTLSDHLDSPKDFQAEIARE